jgi:hypothetical protein
VAGENEARFVIALDSGPAVAGAKTATSALEELRSQILKDTSALQELTAAAGRLKGSADVVRFEALGKDLAKARAEAEKLESKLGTAKGAGPLADTQKALDAARARVSKIGAEREKLGQTDAVKAYQDVTAAIGEKQRAIAAAQSQVTRMGATLKDAAGPAKDLGEAIVQIPGPIGGIVGQLQKVAAFVGPIGVIVAAFVLLTTVAISAAVAIGHFALVASDAARSASILREAAAGSAAGGKALDASIERVYARTSASREQVAGLALELRRSQLAGAALEAALSSVTTTTQVMGDQAGGILKGLAERAVVAKRFVLQPIELRGTGLSIKDVAGQLAQQMKLGIGAAQQALQNGQVKIEDGLKALDAAVQLKFGKLAKSQMLALPVQLRRAGENLADLFKNVDPTKLLEGLDQVLGLLDKSTSTGKALRAIVDGLFGPMGAEAGRVFPIIRVFIMGLIVGALDAAIAFLKVRNALREALGPSTLGQIDGMKLAFEVAAFSAQLILSAVLGIMAAMAVLGATTYLLVVQPIENIAAAVDKALAGFDGKKFVSAGANLVEGIIEGVRSKSPLLFDTIAALATGGLSSFTAAAKIQSPSKAFAEKARFIPEGVAEGVEQGKPKASAAIAGLASTAPFEAAGASAGGGAGAQVTMNVHIEIKGASAPQQIDKQGFLSAMVEVVEDAVRLAGLPRPTVVVT